MGCPRTTQNIVAFRGVSVVDVIHGSLIDKHTVVVEGNRIVAVGPMDEIKIPDHAKVIAAQGTFLIPGLWDMHVHSVANVAWDMQVRTLTTAEWHFPLFLAHGVTGVRNMGDATADPTLQLTNSVKRQMAEGKLLGPRLIASGPTIDGDPPLASNPVVVHTADEARVVVDKVAAHHADFIKVYENLSRDSFFAIIDEAKRRKIPIAGHVPFRVLPKEAADAGQRTFEHVLAMASGCSTKAASEREEFARILSDPTNSAVVEHTPLELFQHERRLYDSRDVAECAETIAAYRRNNVAEAPSLVGYHHVVNAKEIFSNTKSMRLVPNVIRQNWESGINSEIGRKIQSILSPIVPLQSENVRLLNESGVVLLAATDVGIPMLVPGISLHEELVLLVGAGLTPLQALQSATVNPARILGLSDSLGSIEVGKLADLVLLEADPLKDIRNTQRIRTVMANGKLYLRSDLDRLLTKLEALNQSDKKQ